MLLNAKKLAFLGLLLAFDVILIILSAVLEFNTLFLLGGASFCVGIAIRESNKQIGFGFYFASIVLSLILAPNKLYCITYSTMSLYLIIIEYTYDRLIVVKKDSNRRRIFWIVKYVVFNIMYLPMVIFLPKLFYQGKLDTKIVIVLILGGQVALYLYDKAYEYFQQYVWGRIRRNLKL